MSLLKSLRSLERLLSGRKERRRKHLERLLKENLFPLLRREDLEKALEGRINPIASIRDNFVFPFWKNSDGVVQRIFKGIVRRNWDVITEILSDYETIKRLLLEAKPSLEPLSKHKNFRRLVESVAAYIGAVLTVACWDCFCCLCGRKVTPVDFIYFPDAKVGGNPLPYAYRFAHHKCYADLIRRSGVLEKLRRNGRGGGGTLLQDR